MSASYPNPSPWKKDWMIRIEKLTGLTVRKGDESPYASTFTIHSPTGIPLSTIVIRKENEEVNLIQQRLWFNVFRKNLNPEEKDWR